MKWFQVEPQGCRNPYNHVTAVETLGDQRWVKGYVLAKFSPFGNADTFDRQPISEIITGLQEGVIWPGPAAVDED